MSLQDWIQRARELGASDLHLETGTPAVFRIRGELTPIGEPVGGARLAEVGQALLGAEAWNRFLERGSADVSTVASGLRCRVSLFCTIRGVAMAVRLLAPAVSDLRSCNLHPDLRRLIDATSGLAVISGPTGSGKSTTLAGSICRAHGTSSRSRPRSSTSSPITSRSSVSGRFQHTAQASSRRSWMRCGKIPTYSSWARCARRKSFASR